MSIIQSAAAAEQFLHKAGLRPGMHILLHSSFRKIRLAFPGLSGEALLMAIQDAITPKGSLIMPAFTYCFKKSSGQYERFDREQTPGKTGYLAELFRKMPGVIRTSSPTHSFTLWGRVTREIDPSNSPASPLGAGSVLEWLHHAPGSYILMLGVDFSAMTFCHYLEIQARLPWYDYSPWHHLGIEPFGLSTSGEQSLREIPGCSKPFVNFENFLRDHHTIKPILEKDLNCYLVTLKVIYEAGLIYFKYYFEQLLCEVHTCKACDERRQFYQSQP